jgi:hypothetical protein
VKQLTDGEGADVLVDTVGTVQFDAMRRGLGVNRTLAAHRATHR